MVTLLTIINTLLIIFILVKIKIIDIDIRRDETFWKDTLIGYDIWVNRFYIRIPIRNKRKVELKEEIEKLMEGDSYTKTQTLYAKFSWLKTEEEVKQFEKDYNIVDPEMVSKLVETFYAENNG